MIPTVDNAHVTEGQGLITSRYANQRIVPGIVKAFWSIINGVQLVNHPQAGGPWDVLDKLGAIVGIARNALSDADYVPQIRIKVRVNHSHGLAEDIIQIANLVATGSKYYEWFPAAFEVDLFSTTTSIANAMIRWLGEAKSAGTAGNLRFSLTAPANNITWDSVVAAGGPLAAARGFKDSVGGGFPNVMVSLQPLVHP
jgi:hypothetical protein